MKTASFGRSFEPDLCNMPSPLFTGLPAMMQNLPFARHGVAMNYAGRVPMNRSEQVAKYVIETIHKGARAEFRCQQSAGEYDFDLTYADGIRAAVEVTRSTPQYSLQTLTKLRDLECSVGATACQHSWLVHPLPTARIRLVLKNVDRYLSAIESEGINQFLAEPGRESPSPSVSNILRCLQIVEGSTLLLPPPARIWVAGPSPSAKGSIVKAGDLQRAIEDEANKTDNKRKLAASQCRERHLFVYVDSLNTGPWQALIAGCIPEQPPALPAEVTHAWAATDEAPNGIIVWTAEPAKKWQDRGVISSCWPSR
jgi:hypothetical protein